MQQLTPLQYSRMPRPLQAMLAALENGVDQIEQGNYPPHNIYRTDEDNFHIEIAAAGFSVEEIDISLEKSELRVSGTKSSIAEDKDITFLHRGIAKRDFRRTYRLGEYIVVSGAEMKNGILSIHLVREVPEEARARKIDIKMLS